MYSPYLKSLLNWNGFSWKGTYIGSSMIDSFFCMHKLAVYIYIYISCNAISRILVSYPIMWCAVLPSLHTTVVWYRRLNGYATNGIQLRFVFHHEYLLPFTRIHSITILCIIKVWPQQTLLISCLISKLLFQFAIALSTKVFICCCPLFPFAPQKQGPSSIWICSSFLSCICLWNNNYNLLVLIN